MGKKVLLAESAGYCFGVKRAVDMASELVDSHNKPKSYGDVIHNPQVVSELSQKGLRIVRSLEELESGDSVLVRSHGITRPDLEMLTSKGFKIQDATCPFVTKAQRIASRFSNKGYYVVILGEKEHVEVAGILSYIDGESIVISGTEEARELPEGRDYALLSQTTQSVGLYQEVLEIIKEKSINFTHSNTICDATEKRQSASYKIARDSDAVVVIGGRNSGNTQRLYEICKEVCPVTYKIETVKELTPEMFHGLETVGIAAGASTPDYLIKEVISYLEGVD